MYTSSEKHLQKIEEEGCGHGRELRGRTLRVYFQFCLELAPWEGFFNLLLPQFLNCRMTHGRGLLGILNSVCKDLGFQMLSTHTKEVGLHFLCPVITALSSQNGDSTHFLLPSSILKFFFLWVFPPFW